MNQAFSARTEHPGFRRLVLFTAIVTFMMIVIGAITRVSESGMGCGIYWPSCNGLLVPEFVNTAVVIEYGHRLFALLVGVFALATLVQAVRLYKDTPRVLYPVILGFVLYFVQSGLGALTVRLSNEWLSVLIHLANSMLLLACYLVAWVNVRSAADVEAQAENDEQRGTLPLTEVIGASVLAYSVALVGAVVAGNNAAYACGTSWPLCFGAVWPSAQGPLQTLNMTHRLIAGGLGIVLLTLAVQVWRSRASALTRSAIAFSCVMYLMQAALGALVIFSAANPDAVKVITRSLHVTFAAATWSAMVILSGVTWLQQSYRKQSHSPVQPQSSTARSATIFN